MASYPFLSLGGGGSSDLLWHKDPFRFLLSAFLPPIPGPMPVVMSAASCWNILFPVLLLVLAVGHSLPFSPGAWKILGMGVWLGSRGKSYMLVVMCPLPKTAVALTRKVGNWSRYLGPCLCQVVTPVLMFGSGQGPKKEKQCLDQSDGSRQELEWGRFHRVEAVYFSLGRLGPAPGVPIAHLFTGLLGPLGPGNLLRWVTPGLCKPV